MIITYDALFGYGIIDFQLIGRIAIDNLQILNRGIKKCIHTLRFSYHALSTRHEVPKVLHL